MKNTLTFVLAFLCIFAAQAQIIVTSATFPAAGDTLRYAQALNPNLPNILTPPGGGQAWDLSSLSASNTSKTVYLPATQGQNVSQYPGADMVVLSTAGEQYYNVTSSKFEWMGYSSNTLFGYNFNVLFKYQPSLIERRALVQFFDISQQTSNLILPIPKADLPPALVSQIPNSQLIDSLRIRTNIQILDVVDGWGTLTIPGPPSLSQYPVLRDKQTRYTTTALDVHSFLGWINVPTSSLGGGLSAYLGTDTTVTYRFLNDVAKEEIAVLTLNNAQNAVQSVLYKNNAMVSSIGGTPVSDEPTVRACPNPASDRVRFDCANLPAGTYTLRLFDTAGRVVASGIYPLAGNQSIPMELSRFQKGIYSYRLEDENGKVAVVNWLIVD
ncbi:MAG: T9SS type A sorting domain-containing protein [Saprospiraceae bacterium]|nr:T9SS type A sorting domain-containing protein [Saprospiraceae bacterium]